MIDPMAALRDIAAWSSAGYNASPRSSLARIWERADGCLRGGTAPTGPNEIEPASVTLTLTQDQAEHVLLCARMALAQAQLAALQAAAECPGGGSVRLAASRRDTFAGLVDALQQQITER